MDDLLTTEDLKSKPLTKPASKWKNRWQIKYDIATRCAVCGLRFNVKANTINEDHCTVYPSKDIAESMAGITLSGYKTTKHYWAEYLGAFPID